MKTKQLRVCALWHEACGIVQTKVIFRDGGHKSIDDAKEIAYWMDREVYDKIPLMTEATPEDYRKFGVLNLAQNTDIYSNL